MKEETTIEACRIRGIHVDELFPKTLDDFKREPNRAFNVDPEVSSIWVFWQYLFLWHTQLLQVAKIRYQSYETKRLKKLAIIIQATDESQKTLIKKQQETENNLQTNSNKFQNSLNLEISRLKGIEEQRDKLESLW